MTVTLTEVRHVGHSGTCDHDDGRCGAAVRWVMAERATPACAFGTCSPAAHGHVALALYCDDHIGLAPVAGFADIQASTVDKARIWPDVIDAYPRPVRITGGADL